MPLVVLFDLACTALVGGRNWRQVSRVELARLFPWMLLGIFLGVTLLRNAGARWPLIVLGCFVLTVCARGLRGGRGASQEPLPTPWALPFGVFGGVFSALFGTGGPIYTIYLSRRIAALDAFRATISVVILASGVVRAGAFAAAGLYGQPAMLKSAALLPVALAGLYAGSRLRTRVAPARLQRLIFLLLAVAGAGRSIAGGCRLRDGAVAASGMRSYPRDGARAAAPRRPRTRLTSPSAWRTPRPWRCSRASAA